MIRTALMTLALICAADRASALTDMPFNPHPTEVDYVVTMNFVSGPSKGVITVTHHAGWLRVDRTISSITIPRTTTTYYGRKDKVSVQLHTSTDGETVSIYSGTYDPLAHYRPTGERQTYLGEQCSVWKYDLGETTQRLKCVTDDGIEVWDRFISTHKQGQTYFEATKIERRMVDKTEVYPPRHVLDLEYWLKLKSPKAGPLFQLSAEVVLEHIETPSWSKIVRQIGPWYFRLERQNDVISSLRIVDLSAGFNLQYSQIVSGGKMLQISSRPPADHKVAFPFLSAHETGENETLLGEECKWFDMARGWIDVNHFQCLTSDGVLLKEKGWGYGSKTNANTPPSEATKLTRGAVKLDDIMPPKELLLRSTWGLPE